MKVEHADLVLPERTQRELKGLLQSCRRVIARVPRHILRVNPGDTSQIKRSKNLHVSNLSTTRISKVAWE